MSERVTMPALGESVTEGTVTRWLKQVGDTIAVDEPLLEVSTDKVDTEIPSPIAGVLQEILVAEDETVPVGAALAVIGDGAQAPAADAGGSAEPAAEPVTEPPNEPAQPAAAPAPVQAEPAPVQAEPAQVSTDVSQSGTAQAGGSGGDTTGGDTTVTMPALGESVTEGTVTRWLKAEGEEVALDEPLLEVSTDKVDTEIPSPVAGTLRSILVAEDETVPVGADLAVIGSGAAGATAPQSTPAAAPEQVEETRAAAEQPVAEQPVAEQPVAEQSAPAPASPAPSPAPAAPAAAPTSQPPAPASSTADASAYVTPLVRKMASEYGVDLATVTGTGVGGRIRKQDVLDAAETATTASQSAAATPAPAPALAPGASSAGDASLPMSVSAKRGTSEKMSRLRKIIATRMVESLQTSAQLTTVVEVDVTKVARLRDRAKRDFAAREGVKLSFLPFFALAAIEALKANPTVNASLEGDQIIYHAQENLGIAVDTERGLLVPVIRDAGDLNIAGLARKVADLAERTRNNKITPDELGGGTFTLTNTGSRGALFDTPIINQPQVAILGTGSVVKRPVVVNDTDGGETIAIRSMVYLALSYDHRIVDGADAAVFLVSMKSRLEEGAFDADLGL